MSESRLIAHRWLLILATVGLSALFAVAFMLTIEKTREGRAVELSVEAGLNNRMTNGEGMTMTPRLSSKPAQTAPIDRVIKPSPFWPALLFSLAFLCGWLFRHALLEPLMMLRPGVDAPDDEDQSSAAQHAVVEHAAIDKTDSSVPDLTRDFPWDDDAINTIAGLSGAERIERLEKQNASKAEIIKALERLVAENREKWLHRDETEARLDRTIRELSDDLDLAVRQLQALQSESASKSGTSEDPAKER
ncbi:MAG: hypothetical protein AAF465_06980 [Pseudomonadota bacterium]